MSSNESRLALTRTRWSAIGAAVAITLGAGGIGMAQASIDSGDKPVTVTVDARRILDTRTNLGLAGAFAKDTPREVQVTGSVDVATDTGTAKETVVPPGATAVLVNVTVAFPTDQGFLTLRAGGAAGAPNTSTVNFQAGSVEPNAATVDLSADGKIQVWVFMPSATAKADVLIDVVGYTFDHNHDDRYYTEGEVDAAVAAAVAPKANSADVYTKAEVDGLIATLDARLVALETEEPLYAHVDASATPTITRGSHALSVTYQSLGDYVVTFDQDISACAYAGVTGRETSGTPVDGSTINITPSGANGVWVEVFDATGAEIDEDFYVIVIC